MDHHRSGAGSPLQLRGSRPHRRVDDPLQVTTCRRVSENDVGKPRPIESPVNQDLRTEALNDRGKPGSARFDDFPGQYVSVDDDRTTGCKLSGHQAFARRDTAGQAYSQGAKSAGAGELLTQRL